MIIIELQNNLCSIFMLCVHCLKETGKTRDHIFPKHWYPLDTPSSVQRPTVPSCKKCNNELGKAEQEIFIKLAMCLDPSNIKAIGINMKLYKSFGFFVDTKKVGIEEVKKRQNILNKIFSQIKDYDPKIKPFPGFGYHKDFAPQEHKRIDVPAIELLSVAKKIIRGLEFIYGENKYITKPHELKVYFIDVNIDLVDSLLKKFGVKKHYGPGFVVERAIAGGGSGSVLYRITIWDTLVIYGSVLKKIN